KAETILVVSENGYGKRSDLEDYRVTNRGGKGVKTLNITDKTGDLVTIKSVLENDELMIINKSGICIRMAICDIRVMGRATQGVRVIKLNEGDQIASVARIDQALADVVAESESQIEELDSENTSIVNPKSEFGTEFGNETDEGETNEGNENTPEA
ncbi:MAG: DNA gyrase C-terminal beta-propeller domain-containing protein, partial [Bacteroidota bacterium]